MSVSVSDSSSERSLERDQDDSIAAVVSSPSLSSLSHIDLINNDTESIREGNDYDVEEEKNDELMKRELQSSGVAVDSFFCHICYSVRTPEALAEEGDVCYRVESCSHVFCLTCLQSYLEACIIEGKTQIKCCCLADEELQTPSSGNDDSEPKRDGGTIKSNAVVFCDALFSCDEINIILVNKPTLKRKYDRFKLLKENNNGRECPVCCHLQLHAAPDKHNETRRTLATEAPLPTVLHTQTPHVYTQEQSNLVVCENVECGTVYCFQHALAHPSTMTCEEYEKSIATSVKASTNIIESTSKPCPNCGIRITKSDGCNHMKCTYCQQCFCWICGVAVEDAVFPSHFQWWNAMGCANMQMAEEVVPTRRSIIYARVTALLQTIIFGPLCLVSALLSFMFCFPCIYCYTTDQESNAVQKASVNNEEFNAFSANSQDNDDHEARTTAVREGSTSSPTTRSTFSFVRTFQSCLSGWGLFYLCILVVVPLAVLCGALYVVCWLCYVLGYVVSYPFYYYFKVKKGEKPRSFLSFFVIRRGDLDISGPPTTMPTSIIPPRPASMTNFSENIVDNVVKADVNNKNKLEVVRDNYNKISAEEDIELRKLEEGLSMSPIEISPRPGSRKGVRIPSRTNSNVSLNVNGQDSDCDIDGNYTGIRVKGEKSCEKCDNQKKQAIALQYNNSTNGHNTSVEKLKVMDDRKRKRIVSNNATTIHGSEI